MQKKLTFIADRYLVISYGISSLTHALVYDAVQKRFGKLKVNHVACFQYDLLTDLVSDIPRKSIAFVSSAGTISVVNFAVAFTNRSGVLLSVNTNTFALKDSLSKKQLRESYQRRNLCVL
jgi:hypothetical protein